MLDHAKTFLIVGLFVFSLFQLGQVSTLENAVKRYRAEISSLEKELEDARKAIKSRNDLIEQYRKEALEDERESDIRAVGVLDSLPEKIVKDHKVSATPVQLNNWMADLFR